MSARASDPGEADCSREPVRSPSLAELRARLEECAGRFAARADLHAVLASSSRLKILAALGCAGELSVCELARLLGITPAAVSQHLARLKAAGLVRPRRDGMTTYYRVVRAPEEAAGTPLPDLGGTTG